MSRTDRLTSESIRIVSVGANASDHRRYAEMLDQAWSRPINWLAASTGADGLALCRAECPTCMLLDFELPDMDGLDFLRALSAQDVGGCELPVIMLADDGDQAVAVEAMKLGASDYLVKERLTAESLRRAIDHAVDRDAQQRLIRRYQSELELRQRELEEFVQVVAHDLKSPLISIAACLERALSASAGSISPESAGAIERSIEIVGRLDAMTQALLDYSRARGRHPEIERVEAAQAVGAAIEHLQCEIEARGALVAIGDAPAINADASMMIQLFQNLISNAVKFCFDRRPIVRIAAERRQSAWVFSVSDNGVGIEPRFGEQIFRPFERLHSVDEVPGSGLGLATCKWIVERHGGRIWFESQPGIGTTFYFTLPDEPSTAAPAHIAVAAVTD